MIDFNKLVDLADELDCENPISVTIFYLAAEDVPMSEAVIKLGIACGVLPKDYHNG